jgi:hypothetical protein
MYLRFQFAGEFPKNGWLNRTHHNGDKILLCFPLIVCWLTWLACDIPCHPLCVWEPPRLCAETLDLMQGGMDEHPAAVDLPPISIKDQEMSFASCGSNM